MEKNKVIAKMYEVSRLDDIGEVCEFIYKCPYCGEEITRGEIIYYGAIFTEEHRVCRDTICKNCKRELTVINPNPNEE